jgi:hypothetical protein
MAQNDAAGTTGVVLNHVGIAVPGIPDAAAFYTRRWGSGGVPQRRSAGDEAAVQISKSTFLELQQANAQRPAGISHWPEAPKSRARSRPTKRGAMATDPGAPSAFSHAILANVTDLNGLRIELAEMGPESLQRKAMDSWK